MTLAERIFGSPVEDISPEALLAVLAEAEACQLDLFDSYSTRDPLGRNSNAQTV